MAKLLHMVIGECGQCPYCEKVEAKHSHYCSAPNRFIQVNPKEIPEHCPLPNATGTGNR